jgi:hypothetical protein
MRAANPQNSKVFSLTMNYISSTHPAEEAARIALEKAHAECVIAGLNPEPYAELLTDFVTIEVRKALAEMAEHQAHGGPSAIIMLSKSANQRIYFSDSGRRAAEELLRKLNIKDGEQIH